ncbi:MAG: zinc-binding dehydrogenase, partial [Calditrichia bacterium]
YFSGKEEVQLRREPLPPLKSGEVLVRSLYSAVSAGTELLFYCGQAPENMAVDESISSLSGKIEYPLKYGYAVAGEITAAAKGLDPQLAGKRIFAFHPHQSHFIASLQNLIILPEEIEPREAVFLANMETAVNLLLDGAPLLGERVAVTGLGIVGILTTALLSRFPLNQLLAVDLHQKRREIAKTMGTLQASEHLETVKEHSGFDLIFELSGNPAALNDAIQAAAYDGRIVVGSWYGSKPASLELGGPFHRRRLKLISSQVSTIAPALRGRWNKQRRLGMALQLLGEIQPERLISHEFNFEEAPRAYRLLKDAPQEALQVVFKYADE